MTTEIEIKGANEKDVEAKTKALKRSIEARGLKSVPSTVTWDFAQTVSVTEVFPTVDAMVDSGTTDPSHTVED